MQRCSDAGPKPHKASVVFSASPRKSRAGPTSWGNLRWYERSCQRILLNIAPVRRSRLTLCTMISYGYTLSGNVRICQFVHSISAFSTISSFSFNRLSSKLVGMFLEIVPMFVAKDFVRRCFIARADMREFRRARTFWRVSARRSNPEQNPLARTLELS